MTVIERKAWRENVRDAALSQRLLAVGCPVSLEHILATRSDRNGPLTEWVRSQLTAGIMLRTSQAEHLSLGDSLVETARMTGIEVNGVLYTLTRLEAEESTIAEFHFAPNERMTE